MKKEGRKGRLRGVFAANRSGSLYCSYSRPERVFLYAVENQIIFFQHHDDTIYPHLKLVHRCSPHLSSLPYEYKLQLTHNSSPTMLPNAAG